MSKTNKVETSDIESKLRFLKSNDNIIIKDILKLESSSFQ